MIEQFTWLIVKNGHPLKPSPLISVKASRDATHVLARLIIDFYL